MELGASAPIPASRASPGRRRRVLSPALRFLQRRPILCLTLLTPGIPEYLSSSSTLAGLVVNPVAFAIFLAANLGMYLPGVLLIREAQVRWQKGWGSVMALGAAYAIVEEGIGLSTMFDPNASVVGGLGSYGHYLGVSWVWVVGVVMIHVVFSISLPLLLFGLARPDWKSRPLLDRRGLYGAFAILAVDIALLFLFVRFALHFSMSPAILVGSILAVGALGLLAYRLPADLLRPPRPAPDRAPFGFFLVGAVLFPVTIVLEAAFGYWHVPPVLTILAVLLFYGGLLGWVWVHGGVGGHDRQRIAFAAGAITPIAIAGLLASIAVPVVLLADVAAVLFFRHLWRNALPPEPVAPVPRAPGSGAGPRPVT